MKRKENHRIFFNRGEVPNCHRYGAAFIPSAKSNSSNRIRAAYSAHGPNVLSEKIPSRRGPVEKKSNKNTLLLLIIKSARFPNQPRIHILFLWMINNNNKKLVNFLSIAKRELYVPLDHFYDNAKGLINRPLSSNTSVNFLPVPRQEAISITASLTNP